MNHIFFVYARLMMAAGMMISAGTAAAQSGGGNNPNCSAAAGQAYIDAGDYSKAVKEFSCVIAANPANWEGYRGRMEAYLLLGQYGNALRDYARVTAYVMPVDPQGHQNILGYYGARLTGAPDNVAALTGMSFAHWAGFQYAQSIQTLNHLVDLQPNGVYGRLFRGSCRFLKGAAVDKGLEDLNLALQLAPGSPDVRFILADAYTYGQPDVQRALTEAHLALAWGLDIPRVRAILGVNYIKQGNMAAGAAEFYAHFQQVTTDLQTAPALAPGQQLTLALVPGRTWEIPVTVAAGQTLSVGTASRDFYDTVLVLLAPDGTPVAAADDTVKYFAGLDWVAPAAGTYRVRVTSFEAIDTGNMQVARQ